MTTAAFDRLLYTDCTAGVGRGGGGGFQVQAQSVGVDSAQSDMAVRSLLYDAQTPWIVERRAVEDFPLGFAHACSEGYGTAQSRYVGKESTGARQGNHLADCLLTRDPGLYGPTRPAQLWQSGFWRGEQWETPECPQFDGFLQPGPLTIDAVADWLRERSERSATLARLLSVLENPDGRRVVMAAETPGETLRWVAAATLLLPMHAALSVSFKVFVSNLQSASAQQRLVAVPKELNPETKPGRASSSFVLDAETGECDEAEVSARAAFWVELLNTAEDGYDVVDAVELAQELTPEGSNAEAHLDACRTAWSLTVVDEPLADPAPLARWLAGADAAALSQHGPAVAGRALEAEPGAEALRWIDGAAEAGTLDVDRALVRTRLLGAEIAAAREGAVAPSKPLTQVIIGEESHRDAESEISLAISHASNSGVDMLLRVAKRHAVRLAWPPLQSRLEEFVGAWVDDPTVPYRPNDWALREQILDLTLDALQGRFTERGIDGIMTALQYLSGLYADRQSDPTHPVGCHLAVAAAAGLPSAERAARMYQTLCLILASPGIVASAGEFQRAALTWDALGPREAMDIVGNLPAGVSLEPQIADIAIREAKHRAEHPDACVLAVVRRLQERNALRGAPALTKLLNSEQAVRAFIDATRMWRDLDPKNVQRLVAGLEKANERVVEVWLDDLWQAIADSRVVEVGVNVLRVVSGSVADGLVARWGHELGGRHYVDAAVLGVFWYDGNLPDERASLLKSQMRESLGRLRPADQERWRADVEAHLGRKYPDYAEVFAEMMRTEKSRPRLPWRGREEKKR